MINAGAENSGADDMLALLLEEAALNGSRCGERYPEKRFFGYFCSYWPEEVVLAAGFEPLRLLPQSVQAVPGALTAFCCSLSRGCLATAERGGYNHLAGAGFAHTCDTMQCLGGIWHDVAGPDNTLQFVPPVTMDAPGAGLYYRVEFEALINKMSLSAGRKIKPDALQNAIAICRHTRRLAAGLDSLRPFLPSPLVAALLRAGQVMPRDKYNNALEQALPAIKEKADHSWTGRRVLISGAVLENDSLYNMLEELGGRVVADDTCTGFRHFHETGEAAVPGDPLQALVNRYASLPPCPCRSRGVNYRVSYLADLARERKARGAVLVIRKYCEPHAWDAVPVVEALKKAGLRTMVLELEGADAGGQERTRLQAFLESIE